MTAADETPRAGRDKPEAVSACRDAKGPDSSARGGGEITSLINFDLLAHGWTTFKASLRIHVTAETTMINGFYWDRGGFCGIAFDDLDFDNAFIDQRETILGPGPFLAVAYRSDDEFWLGIHHHISPYPRRLAGRVDFVRDFESPSGWSMVPR